MEVVASTTLTATPLVPIRWHYPWQFYSLCYLIAIGLLTHLVVAWLGYKLCRQWIRNLLNPPRSPKGDSKGAEEMEDEAWQEPWDMDGEYEDPDRWTSTQAPGVPGANTVGEHAGSTGQGGPQGDHEYDENYREGHPLLDEVTRGSEAEEKGSGLFGREKLATVEGSSLRVRGHAMVGYEEAELEGQLATVNELFYEFNEGAWQTEVEGHLGEKEKPEFPPQPPLWWDSRHLEESAGGLAAFITRRKKDTHKTIEGEKREEKEKPRGAAVAMVGDRPHRHLRPETKGRGELEETRLTTSIKGPSPRGDEPKMEESNSNSKVLQGEQGQAHGLLEGLQAGILRELLQESEGIHPTHGQQDLGQLGREGVARVLVCTCT